MRRLVLMRHAKTEAHHVEGDKARRLTRSGREDAHAAGVALGRLGLTHALVSTSARTRETFANLGLDLTPDFVDSLYLCGTDTLAWLIAQVDDSVDGLLVVAHAPAVPDLAARLTYESLPAEAERIAGWFPTSAFSTFTIDGTWADLLDGGAEYGSTTRPRS